MTVISLPLMLLFDLLFQLNTLFCWKKSFEKQQWVCHYHPRANSCSAGSFLKSLLWTAFRYRISSLTTRFSVYFFVLRFLASIFSELEGHRFFPRFWFYKNIFQKFISTNRIESILDSLVSFCWNLMAIRTFINSEVQFYFDCGFQKFTLVSTYFSV